jgi:antitoxin PrlF
MIQSKLTAKAQTTIPQSVRKALRLQPGDAIAYRIEGGQVVMTRAESDAAEDPFRTFSEWSSEADEKAYGGL